MSELVERITEALEMINLPSLTRPSIGPNEAATLELVRFDLSYYAYSAIAYVRDLFAGLTVLSAKGNGACGDVIGRCLYEWTMQASYVLLRTRESLGSGDIVAARSVLERLELANDWISTHGGKYWTAPDQEDIPKNVRLGKFREAFGKYSLETLKRDNTEDDYGYLSQHAHPNSVCFLKYRRIAGPTVAFGARVDPKPYRGVITAAGLQWVMCIHSILELAGETDVRADLRKLLNSLGGQ